MTQNQQLTDWIDELDDDDKPRLPKDTEATELADLADKYDEYEFNIKSVEEALAHMKAEFLRLKRETIPDRMQELGVKKFVLTDGSELSYKPVHSGALIDEVPALQWLEDNGYAEVVKDELTLTTSRLDSSIIDEIKQFVASLKNVSFKEKVSIHHMTLGSLIKDLASEGKSLPKELFNVYIGNVASLKKGKQNV